MTKVKDGFWKQLGSKVGSNDYLLKAAGGYIGVGNSAGEVVPLNNSTRNAGLNADMVDGYHLSDLDNRYVNVTGDTMTGMIAFRYGTTNTDQFFTFGDSDWTEVVKLGIRRDVDLYGPTYVDKDNNYYTLLHAGNWKGIVDGRYVKKSGDTMTGRLRFKVNNNDYMELIHDSDTGLYNYRVGTQWFHIVSTSSMYFYTGTWDSAGHGNYNKGIVISLDNNIGIGTSSPSYKLDVVGDVRTSNSFIRAARSNAYGKLVIGNLANGDDGIFYNSTSDMWFRIQSQSCIHLSAKTTAGADAFSDRYDLFIKNDTGYVGINTRYPSSNLHVHGVSGEILRLSMDNSYTAGAGPLITFRNGPTGEHLATIGGVFNETQQGNRANLIFGTRTSDAAGVETKMTILHNGNTGIGCTPSYKLDVSGVTNTSSYFLRSARSNAYGDLRIGSSSGDDGIFYNSTSDMWFRIQSQSCIVLSATSGTTAWATRYDLFIKNDTGYVGINTTSPSYNLHVNGPGKIQQILIHNNNEIDNYDGDKIIFLNYRTTGNVRMVEGGGMVGIGTAPSYKLHVAGTIYTSNTFISSSTEPLRFYGAGSGTYNQSCLYVNSSNVIFETPRVSNSDSADIVPFKIHTRGGQGAPLYAGKFVTEGGTSTQFVKGDGSLDSNTYVSSATLDAYLPLTGGIMTGNISWNTDSHGLYLYNGCGIEKWSGYGPSLVAESGTTFEISSRTNRSIRYTILHSGNYTNYTYSQSDLYTRTESNNRYVYKSGDTMTGGITFKYGGTSSDMWITFKDSSSSETVYLGIRKPLSSYGPTYVDKNGNYYTLIHTGNIGNYTSSVSVTNYAPALGKSASTIAQVGGTNITASVGDSDKVDGLHFWTGSSLPSSPSSDTIYIIV